MKYSLFLTVFIFIELIYQIVDSFKKKSIKMFHFFLFGNS